MQEKIRRKPEAIVKSFEMDPQKKAIYVEGMTDRFFFEYLFDNEIGDDTIIFEIDTVDIPNVDEDGNRNRLIYFAEIVQNTSANIKCFIDADFSRILEDDLPKCVILTDFRDLEAYLYDKKYLSKFIKLGLKTDKYSPETLLDEITFAQDIAYLRICSKLNSYNLPFKKTNTNFSRYYEVSNGINLNKYISALIQGKSLKRDEIETSFTKIKDKYNSLNIRDILHGKDVIEIIKEIAKSLNYKKDNIELVFWMSFDKEDLNNFPALKELSEFIN